MKKLGLTFMTVLFVTVVMVGGAQAHWHGYYRGWGPGIYWGGPVVVMPPPADLWWPGGSGSS